MFIIFSKKEQLLASSKAAKSLLFGDQMSRTMRSSQNWSLLPMMGTLSCAIPPVILGAGKDAEVDGFMVKQLVFPSFFGKFSTFKKRQRLVQELEEHAGGKMSGPLQALATDYISVLKENTIMELIKDQKEAIQ